MIFWGFFNFFQLFLTFYHFSSYFHSEYVKSDFRDFCSKTSGPSLLKRLMLHNIILYKIEQKITKNLYGQFHMSCNVHLKITEVPMSNRLVNLYLYGNSFLEGPPML